MGGTKDHSPLHRLSGPVSHLLNSLSINAWGIIQRMKEFAAKNYGEGDLFNWIKQSRS